MALWEKEEFTISTDQNHLDLQVIHRFLSEDSYWAKGISFDAVKKAVENSSLIFGVYQGNPTEKTAMQVGSARIITDFVRIGWIMDVFILPEFRGRGLSKWLMEIITEHPELKEVRKLMLSTKDAHGLYTQYGFAEIENPELYLQKRNK